MHCHDTWCVFARPELWFRRSQKQGKHHTYNFNLPGYRDFDLGPNPDSSGLGRRMSLEDIAQSLSAASDATRMHAEVEFVVD